MLLLLLACAPEEEPVPAPTLAWLDPTDGATVPLDAACSVVVENFTLEDPASHGDGAAAGHVAVSVDGAEVLRTGASTFNLSLSAGAHELSAQLFYEDGDEVTTADGALCAEDAEGCEVVVASVSVVAE